MKLATYAFFVLGSAAYCCGGMPERLIRPHLSLVKEATAIVLIEVVPGDEPRAGHFKIIRILKGSSSFVLPFLYRAPDRGDWMTSFADHSDPSFWQTAAGRIGVDSDCKAVPPAFEVGHKYLIFVGIQPDTKQAEEITTSNDKWLTFVEQCLSQHYKARTEPFSSKRIK